MDKANHKNARLMVADKAETAWMGALTSTNELNSVINSGREVTVASKTMPIKLPEVPVLVAIMSP